MKRMYELLNRPAARQWEIDEAIRVLELLEITERGEPQSFVELGRVIATTEFRAKWPKRTCENDLHPDRWACSGAEPPETDTLGYAFGVWSSRCYRFGGNAFDHNCWSPLLSVNMTVTLSPMPMR
jgi:hypothetical protein